MSDTCPSCNVPWSGHPGIAVTCRKLREVEAALSAIRFRCLVCGKNQWEVLP